MYACSDRKGDRQFVRLTPLNLGITTKSELIKEQRRCLESFLGIAEKPEDDLAAVECLRTEDSCEWLTSNEPFRTWLKDESVRIFWLTAKPATGKS